MGLEFARAVDGFDAAGSCYERRDGLSDIVAVVGCAVDDERPPVAYLSFNYGESAGRPQQYCGGSDSDVVTLSVEDALSCQDLLVGLASDAQVECNDSFDCKR